MHTIATKMYGFEYMVGCKTGCEFWDIPSLPYHIYIISSPTAIN